jgi:hypothetical protein
MTRLPNFLPTFLTQWHICQNSFQPCYINETFTKIPSNFKTSMTHLAKFLPNLLPIHLPKFLPTLLPQRNIYPKFLPTFYLKYIFTKITSNLSTSTSITHLPKFLPTLLPQWYILSSQFLLHQPELVSVTLNTEPVHFSDTSEQTFFRLCETKIDLRVSCDLVCVMDVCVCRNFCKCVIEVEGWKESWVNVSLR